MPQVYTYAGYHQSPNKWKKGTTPKPISWHAGIQYDGDVARAAAVLNNLTTYGFLARLLHWHPPCSII